MSNNIQKHSKKDFDGMRKAGKLAAQILVDIERHIADGVNTDHINNLCHEMIVSNGAIAAPLNYNGFPKSICTSVNEVVCHGIPSKKCILKDGDIVNVDVTVILDGWHGDTSKTFIVGGRASRSATKLVNVTYDAMMIGIETVKADSRLSDIGLTISKFIRPKGYSIVEGYCGHGIGKKFHDDPSVFHFYCPQYDVILEEGMFFTVEPMINLGKKDTEMLADEWTVVTRDRSLSAQFEHTIGVTSQGCEIFTLPYNMR